MIIGGGRRGVVSTACYTARIYGVKSAMPMFKALALCPSAVVVRPDMEKYARVGREVRTLMLELTPLVEPLSIDEAFLDLAGTERLHGLDVRQEPGEVSRAGSSSAIGISGVDRPLGQQVPRQDRLRSRQAARLRGARTRPRPRLSWRRSR